MTGKFRLLFLILVKYTNRNWELLTVGLLGLIVLLFIAFKLDFLNFTPTISEGFIGTYQQHDLPLEVSRLISSGLVEVDKTGKVIPKLAESWQVNNNATVFTFKLKPNLRWSDGTSLKSSDLVFNIPDIEVSFPNENEITFKLKESYSPFPTLLTKPLCKKGGLVGIGPYKVVKVEKSRIFITKISLSPLVSDLPKIVVRFYPTEKTALVGFELGEVQTLSQVANYGQLLGSSQVKLLQKTDFGKIIAIIYNTKDPLLVNKQTRQALSFITPKNEKEFVANNPLSPFSWAYDPDAKKYLENKESAKQVFEKAKDSVSSDLLKKELILTSTPNLEETGKKIVEAWKTLGINAKLRVEPGIPQNFQSLLIAQSIPIDPDQYFLWHSTQGKTNLTKYSTACCPMSARVDKDLEDGRKIIAMEERKIKYVDFQKTLMEDSPATFLYYPKYNILYYNKAEINLNQLLPLQLSAQYN